jgi:hypothetical protein
MINELIKITKEVYFEAGGLSNSFLKEFDKSPCHAFTQKESTKAMESGTMFHGYILENETFNEKYLVSEFTDARTKEYKSWKILHPDKSIISIETEINLKNAKKNIDKAIFDFQELGEILKNSQKEIACFVEMLGFQCKGLFDALYQKDGKYIIFDLKKCQDALEFNRAIINYKYYRQAAWYISLLKTLYPETEVRFIFIAIEENYPNGCILHELSEDYLHYGDVVNLQSVNRYSEWQARGGDRTELYPESYKIVEKPNFLN